MGETQPTIACDLGALNADERARRSALAARILGRFQEVRELADGYAGRLDGNDAVATDALEWLRLERRCCPFLRLELCFEPSGGPVWIHFRGGAGVKEFLAAAGLRPSPPKSQPS